MKKRIAIEGTQLVVRIELGAQLAALAAAKSEAYGEAIEIDELDPCTNWFEDELVCSDSFSHFLSKIEGLSVRAVADEIMHEALSPFGDYSMRLTGITPVDSQDRPCRDVAEMQARLREQDWCNTLEAAAEMDRAAAAAFALDVRAARDAVQRASVFGNWASDS